MELRISPEKSADGDAPIVLVFFRSVAVNRLFDMKRLWKERTGPENETEKWGSAMHSSAELRHGVLAVGSLVRGNEEDEGHNGSCVIISDVQCTIRPESGGLGD